MRGLPFFVWLGIGSVWGTTWLWIRLGLRDMPPLGFAAARTVIAALALLGFAWATQADRRPRGRELLFWIAVGVPQLGFTYALIFWAEQYISTGLTAMLFAVFPGFTALVSHFLLVNERLTVGKLAGTLLGLVAVYVLVGQPDVAVGQALPVAAVLVAALSAAISSVLVRRHGHRTSTVWLTAVQVAAGALFLVVLAVVFESGVGWRLTPRAISSLVYLSLVVTVGCYLGLFWLLKRIDATLVSMGVIFETVVGVMLGAVVLHEPLEARIFSGLVLVGASIYLVTLKRPSAGGEPVVP